MRSKFVPFFVLLLLLLNFSLPGSAENTEYFSLNTGTEGERIELKTHLIEGKINIIDFYSHFCPPCKAIAPSLKKLAEKDPEVVVGRVDVNRPDKRGIDWGSPISQQFKLRSIPHFKIYDGEGNLIAEGQEGKKKLIELFKKNSID